MGLILGMVDYRRCYVPGGSFFLTVVTERRAARSRYRRRGIWQRRFWKHVLRDERDYARHFDYLHYNPVKHGLVGCPRDWPYSTFHRWVEGGVYDLQWGCEIREPLLPI